MNILAIAFGGAAGSVLRYLLGGAIQRGSHSGFPYGTLGVNVLGSLLIGVLIQRFMNLEPRPEIRSLLIVGFCGGFTTFSTFSSETFGLVSGGEYSRAILYVFLSMTVCIGATALGFGLARLAVR